MVAVSAKPVAVTRKPSLWNTRLKASFRTGEKRPDALLMEIQHYGNLPIAVAFRLQEQQLAVANPKPVEGAANSPRCVVRDNGIHR